MEQDWTQNIKRNGTFVLDDSEMSASMTSSTPAHYRAATPLKQGTVTITRPVTGQSRSKIPSATNRRSMESSMTNGSLMTSSMSSVSMLGHCTNSDEILQAVRQVEDNISPLARANNQIRDSLAQLEKSLIALKAAAVEDTSPNCE